MLFGKKKEENVNPFYSNQQPAQDNQAATPPFPTPTLPMPEPLAPPDVSLKPAVSQPQKQDVSVPLGKSVAFIRLSDYKQVLDDIKTLQTQIARSKDDLERLAKLIQDEQEATKNYIALADGLNKIVSDLYNSLSNVQE
ncbi:MAG: hypothetical protein RAK22_00135 [Nanoarchaeota archaeon]|nr:hypothetical protein [Nanoarchaeota archaeon]